MTRGTRRAASTLLGLALAALTSRAAAAPARPYDAPRVREKHLTPQIPLEYQTWKDGDIVVYYHPSTGERVRSLAGRVAAIRAELSAELGLPVLSPVEIRVAAAMSEMNRLTPLEEIPSNAPALAFSEARLVVMSAASAASPNPLDLEPWLRHELAHLALDEALGGLSVPGWLQEGYAIHFADEGGALRAKVLAVALLERKAMDLAALDALDARSPADLQPGSIAEAEATDFARFLSERPNHARFITMLSKLRAGEGSFESCVKESYGERLGGVEARWRREMARRYSFLPVFAAATLVWVLLLGAFWVRRARKQKALSARERQRGVEAARRASLTGRKAVPGTVGRRGRGRLLDDEVPEGESIVPDPEVPKVEHDGRWHTLH